MEAAQDERGGAMLKVTWIWKLMLAVGLLPFAAVLLSGIYAAVTGFNGMAITSPPLYGLPAFADWVVLYSFVYWPTYVIGIVLIAAAVLLRWKGKR